VGKQNPMEQLNPVAHSFDNVQRALHVASTQSEPAAQSPAFLQLPTGRGLHNPLWHDSRKPHSESPVQPYKQPAFTHQPPALQSALTEHVLPVAWVPASAAPVPQVVQPLPGAPASKWPAPPLLPEPELEPASLVEPLPASAGVWPSQKFCTQRLPWLQS
jgi:hypothetical protein